MSANDSEIEDAIDHLGEMKQMKMFQQILGKVMLQMIL